MAKKSIYQFGTMRGICSPITVFIERERQNPFDDMDIVLTFSDKFDSYQEADEFIESHMAKGVLRAVRRKYKAPKS
jgi:hypothetical protein